MWQSNYWTYQNKTLERLLQCEYEGNSTNGNFNITKCSLPHVTDCDKEGKWIENFAIFDGLPDKFEEIPDIDGNKYCCHHHTSGGNLDPLKVCNWYNKVLFAGEHNTYATSEGQTGFACKHLGDFEKMGGGDIKAFSINVTYNELRSELKSLDGLLDPETHLPWYDTGRQWPKQAECSYGSAMDQMTMTYISFTGYLR